MAFFCLLVQLRVLLEFPNVNGRGEVDAAIGARRRDVGLSPASGSVKERGPWVAVDRESGCRVLWASAIAIAGLLAAVHVRFEVGPSGVDFSHSVSRLESLDIDDLIGGQALVVVSDDANQLVNGLPALLELDSEGALGDVLGLLVQKLCDVYAQRAAVLAKVPLLAVGLKRMPAAPADLGVVVEEAERTADLILELGKDRVGGRQGRGAGAVCLCASHLDWWC